MARVVIPGCPHHPPGTGLTQRGNRREDVFLENRGRYPILVGALLVISMSAILPYALAFAAGAMIFVVAEELIPESQRYGNVDLATMGVIVGFSIVMTLDVALG